MRRLQELVAAYGVTLDAGALNRFDSYESLLLETNQQLNLTRITDPNEVEERLFADSLALLPHLPDGATSLLDLGSGGGIPGLPLAIARPDLATTLVDATGKKVRFLADVVQQLQLPHVTAVQGRAEELARDLAHRERYDVVTARAVARLATLVELTLPFLAVGGRALLPKGAAAEEELNEARWAIGELGGRARQIQATGIAGTNIVIIDKVRPTARTYPRATGIPNKKPLLN